MNDHTLAGELTGKRMSVKDLFDVKGFKTGAGLPAWLRDAPEAKQHAKAVELLTSFGAYLDHKTQLDELAYSLAGNNSHYGISRNPLDHRRYSGGSSSGSAVSVALGESDIGLATDTGGSIRVPASYCGLYGLRPTYGRVPTDGLVPLAPRFDTAGVLTRDLDTMESACKALFAIDSTSNYNPPIEQMLWCESLWQGCELALKQHARRCYESYLGNKREITTPPLDAQKRRECFSILQAVSIWQAHGKWLQNNIHEFGEDIQTRLRWGQHLVSSKEGKQLIDQAEADLKHWKKTVQSWLPERSALLMPTSPSVAPEINTNGNSSQHRNTLLGLTSIAGLSGWPQLQTPVSIDGGLPVGLSLLGREKSDMELIELARQVLG
ncbi:amidase family protein [Vibrio sp. M260118]|uniref:amidase family protein n=1 Tax=Vibrio sp. M260118 TaxID=3020896 RepID=UPI002F41E94B